jgi:hypothetical protein
LNQHGTDMKLCKSKNNSKMILSFKCLAFQSCSFDRQSKWKLEFHFRVFLFFNDRCLNLNNQHFYNQNHINLQFIFFENFEIFVGNLIKGQELLK